MDLHFTQHDATEEERVAVDSIVGPPESGWRGGDRDERSRNSETGGRELRNQHPMLLPVLHEVQSQIGWISHGALNYLCKRLGVPPAEAYGVASFYALFSLEKQPPTVFHVCDDIACKTLGAEALCARLETDFGAENAPNTTGTATWKRSPCLGLCERGPAVFCQDAGVGKQNFTLAPVDGNQILEALKGKLPPRRSPGGSNPQKGEAGLTLLARVGVADPLSLDGYLAQGGYAALRIALQIGAQEVIRELTEAKLSGRGGAAFPTGIKWKGVAEAFALPHFVVCNADESEPGTFKDRVLMEEDPFAVIESLTIAGFACGANRSYLYLRGEYPEALLSLQNAIEQTRNLNFLGADILGSSFDFEIEICKGAGAYICGEETALLESIEGKRGEPRNKPPFPAQNGLFGKPTAINNVETLLNLLPILKMGGDAYSKIGTQGSTGTRLFCLSGCVERPGVYELPYGGTLGDLLKLAGGVRGGKKLQAILLGGAAGVFVRPNELEMPLTLEGARAANATLGSGVVMVFDEMTDMKQILVRIAAFFRDESCGQCVPCRVGTVRQEEALHRLCTSEKSTEADLILLQELEQVMKDASICGLGQTASSAILSAIRRLGMFQGGQA